VAGDNERQTGSSARASRFKDRRTQELGMNEVEWQPRKQRIETRWRGMLPPSHPFAPSRAATTPRTENASSVAFTTSSRN